MVVNVVLNDGARYAGETYVDVVRMMKLDSYLIPATKREYMNKTAERCVVYHGEPIQYETAQEFLHELERVGAIRKVWEE